MELYDPAEYRRAIDELAELTAKLWSDSPELATRIEALVENKPLQLCSVVLNGCRAGVAIEPRGVRLKPSNYLLRLLAAARTNDEDEILIIEHEILALKATTEVT